jgi:hypothetical protein
MGISTGYGRVVTSGSVFAFDTADVINSYKGEPTENILYSAGDTELNDGHTWTNSGTWTYSNDDTSVTKPYIPNVNTNSLLIMSGVTETVGSQHIGCAYNASLTPSTTYTISVWFRQNRAGSNQPYFRTNINNNSLGNFSYNGDTDASNWPINQWIRISATATIQSNENGAYLSNYIGSAVGDKVWYFAPQLEAKSHMTPVTTVARSATQNLLPISGNSTINLTNASFDSNGQLAFDGTNDYAQISNFTNKPVNAITCEAIIKPTRPSVGTGTIRGGAISSTNSMYIGIIDSVDGGNTCAMHWANQTSNSRLYNWNGQIPNNAYSHLVGTYDGTTTRAYLNGVEIWSAAQDGTIPDATYYIGTYGGTIVDGVHNFNGYIPIAKIYNRGLTAAEVKQNYNKYKTKFKLS